MSGLTKAYSTREPKHVLFRNAKRTISDLHNWAPAARRVAHFELRKSAARAPRCGLTSPPNRDTSVSLSHSKERDFQVFCADAFGSWYERCEESRIASP